MSIAACPLVKATLLWYDKGEAPSKLLSTHLISEFHEFGNPVDLFTPCRTREMMLTDLVQVIPPDGAEEPEDIFAFAAGLIFVDDSRVMHGDDRSTIIYKSSRFGDISLKNANPENEDDRKLFAHYLWNAGLKMAELVSSEDPEDVQWSVKNETVMELGAGVGLSGITACLAGAREVVISDYPAKELLDNISRNVQNAIAPGHQSQCRVQGYMWGDCSSEFAVNHKHSFSRIIAADCYWMPGEHENLVRSMLFLLSTSSDARVLAIAGFHTGRAKLAGFFEEAELQGLEVEQIHEEDVAGNRREWAKERDGGFEDHTERKRWLVLAILKRRAA